MSQVEQSHDIALEMPFYPTSLHELIRSARDCMAPVLITGERGTKKRALARSIHIGGALRRLSFVAVRGEHFVDALHLQISNGRALKGTLFIHDIERLTPEGQEVLEDLLDNGLDTGELRIGNQGAECDIRLIASSEMQLSSLMDNPHFNKSLLHRLSIIHIHIAPLRERRGGIPALASFLLDKVCRTYRLGVKSLSPEAGQFLVSCPWPDNMDELEGVLARSAATTSGDTIDIKDFRFINALADEEDEEDATEPAIRLDEMERKRSLLSDEMSAPLTAHSPALRLAHEIKNPLVSIKTYTDLLEDRIEDPLFRRGFYQVMRRDVEKIDRAIMKILAEPPALSQTPGEPGELSSRMVKLSLNRLIEDILPCYRAELSRRRIAVFKELSGEIPCFPMEEQFKEALDRLLSIIISRITDYGDLHITTTASKFMRRTSSDRSFAELAIRGNPAGGALSLLKSGDSDTRRLFAWMRKAVTQHGGLLELKEDGNEGVSVTITLPVST